MKKTLLRILGAVVVLAIAGLCWNFRATPSTVVMPTEQGEQPEQNSEIPYETTFIELDVIAGDFTITQAGHYVVEGTLTDGGIIVDAPESEVILTLKNVHITNPNWPAILFQHSLSSAVIIAENTENYLEDGSEEREYDAALYSVASLTIDGAGSLSVVGNLQEGIATDGNLTINNGTINITSVDDGLNASEDNVSHLQINGGNLTINAGGDGIDSNGSLTINGGTIFASSQGGNGGIDADGEVLINGGEIIALGEMNDTPSSSSSQKSIIANLGNQPAGTVITIKSWYFKVGEQETIISFTLTKSANGLLFSSALIQDGVNYEVYAGETLLTSITTESISTGRGGMGGPNGGNGGGSGGQFSGERQAFAGDRPEIFDDRPGRNANE